MAKKVLYIGFKRADGILVGGGMANARSLRMLRRVFGAENVDTVYVHGDPSRPHRSLLNRLYAPFGFFFGMHNGLTPSHLNAIVRLSMSYDCVFISTSVLGIVAKRLRQQSYAGRIVVHFHNVESLYYDAQMPRWLPGRGVVLRCAARNDRYACQYADRIMTLSQRDADYLARHYDRQADAVVGVSLEDCFRPVAPALMTHERPRCLFVGAYSKPNNEGVLFFVEQVMPHVDVDFKVVGKGMARLKAEHESMKAVEVIGDAPDLRPYIEEADFMILPVFAGSGMKIKTAESLMYGKNILGTDETFVGYDLDPARTGALCNTPAEYIAALQRFSRQPVPVFNAYSRQTFLEKCSEEHATAVFTSVLE